jgi:putative intracellular protease/amidase
MQAVLIAMTILGCDDSVSQCNYVATIDKRWETVVACDAEAEQRLKTFANASYPTVIAVCEAPKSLAAAEPAKPAPVAPAAPDVAEERDGLGAFVDNIAGRVRANIPTGQDVKNTLAKPLHFVSASYSWAAARFTD